MTSGWSHTPRWHASVLSLAVFLIPAFSLALPTGRGTFVGLEVGRYQLLVSEGGRLAARKEVTFRDRVLAEMRIPARPDETTGGTMR